MVGTTGVGIAVGGKGVGVAGGTVGASSVAVVGAMAIGVGEGATLPPQATRLIPKSSRHSRRRPRGMTSVSYRR
jgi:hypothetical protein